MFAAKPAKDRKGAARKTAHAIFAAILFVAFALLAAFVVQLLIPLDPAPFLAARPSGEMVDRNGRVMYAFLNGEEQWCFERSIDELGPRIIQATLASEDQRFYRHFGVDPVAVARAVWQNVRRGRIVSGGSTITMQVVKMHGGTGRSVLGKVVQAVQACRLERRAGKERILNAYLNTAPYGLNLVGAEAASRRYFGKPARELTISEAALIAALPKSPSKLMPLDNPERALVRRNYVLQRMLDEGYISEGERQVAMSEPLGAQWHEFPALAPHLAMLLKPRIHAKGREKIALDADLQKDTEDIVARYMKRYCGEVGNAAAIVVDVPSASVLARMGSASFFDIPGGGQVDACRAARAPGSALKPFTYALAMERNVLYASEALLDDSIDFGAYSPENYDHDYNGLISAADALRHSLNIPAVMVLDRIGAGALHTFLRGIGFSTLTRSPEEYGLGLTLGDCEVRLDEMAAAYCMLAGLGEYRPLQLIMNDAKDGVGGSLAASGTGARQILYRGTCLKVFEMLEQTLPDELEPNLVRANTAPRACWKTGTSTGHHDAWAFVFNRQYLVGVWMGNNDGKASNRLVGMRAALPLAARVFRALPPSSGPAWPDPGEDLRPARICAASGLPASQWCERTKNVLLPRTQYLNRICDVHYPSSETLSGAPRVVERWPGSSKGWDLAKVHVSAPRASEEHNAPARRAGLLIREPANLGEYVLTGEVGGDRVRLRSSLDAEAALYWYLDDQFLGMSSPEKPLLMDLKAGGHTLACMTPEGSLDKVSFSVAEPRSGSRLFKE